MGINVANAQIFGRNPKLPDGFEGDVRITRTFYHQGQRYGRAYIVEFEVVNSNKPDAAPAGKTFSWRQALDGGSSVVAPGSLKAFAAACCGIASDDEDALEKRKHALQEAIDESVEHEDDPDQNVLIGQNVHVIVEEITAKESGKQFRRHTWSPAA
jgi:hypothetical protein